MSDVCMLVPICIFLFVHACSVCVNQSLACLLMPLNAKEHVSMRGLSSIEEPKYGNSDWKLFRQPEMVYPEAEHSSRIKAKET